MAMLGYFSVKLLVSPIIYVCDICLPDHFMLTTFYYCFALDTTFLHINSLTKTFKKNVFYFFEYPTYIYIYIYIYICVSCLSFRIS